MKKTAFIIMIITVISKLFGFLRDIILSYYYGASTISDAYLIALTVPVVIFSFVGIGISTGYIPIFRKIESIHGEIETNEYTSNLVNLVMIISTIIIILGLIFTEPLVHVFASGFEGETLVLAIKFTRISLIGIYFTALVNIATPFLQVKGNYNIPALIGFPLNIVTVIAIILSVKIDTALLALGSILATFSQLILLLPYMYKKGFRYKFRLDINNKYINLMIILVIPLILGTSVSEINTLIDRTLASRIAIGGISALNYATRLNGFIQDIFTLSIITVLYPAVSKMVAEKNIDGMKHSISEALISISLLIIPATVGFMIFPNSIVNLLFGRGAFDISAIKMTSDSLFYYSIGMTAFGYREVLSKTFYSFQDTKTPMINGSIGVGINIILNLILSRYMGIGGLALATSIASIVTTLLLFYSLRKKIGSFGLKYIFISFLKIIISSLFMGVISRLSFNYFIDYGLGESLSLIIAVIIGMSIYFVLILFGRIKEVDTLVIFMRKRINSPLGKVRVE